MKKKRVGMIYLVIMLLIFFGCLFLFLEKQKEPTERGDKNETYITAGSEDDESKNNEIKEYNDMIADAHSKLTNADKEYHIGTCEGFLDSRELNRDFIVNTTKYSDPVNLYDIEFIGYEELDDLKEYKERTGYLGGVEIEPSYPEVINEDGTINKVVQNEKWRYADRTYSDVIKQINNYEFAIVKIDFILKNKLPIENKIYLDTSYMIETFVELDDGNLYEISSVMHNDYQCMGRMPVYVGFENGRTLCDNSSNGFVMEANEEIKGEYVYIIANNEIDKSYIKISPLEDNVMNFKAPYARVIPLSYIKEVCEK